MIDPAIFKAYDVRALYPGELNEAIARDIGRGFVAYLGAKRIAVSRDMRVSSPSLAAAFIEGARAQGADVVDFGLAATDMLYFAVASEGFEGGAQITASHNPKQYNGVKMVREGALPLSGDAGIGEIRDMVVRRPVAGACRAARRLRAAQHARRVRRARDGRHPSPAHPAVQRGARCGQRHGRAGGAAAVRSAALPHHAPVLHDRRHVPYPRGESAHRREPPRHRRRASLPRAPTSASPGTAMRTAAS